LASGLTLCWVRIEREVRMSRFSTPTIRSSGGLDVYTALAGVAAIILLAGCLIMIFHNIQYSSSSTTSDDGGIFQILDSN
jgi:hypothetical protein